MKDGRIAAIGSLEPNGAGGRRRRPRRRAGVHRHPQPLRLHAADGSARGQRDPPGRHDRGRRQLRLRLLPDPRSAAGARARSTATPTTCRSRWSSAGEYFEHARGGRPAVNVLSLVPNGQLRLATLGLADRPADAGGARRDAGAAARVARPGRLGLLDRARVRAGAGGERGGADGAGADGAVLRDAHAQARRGRRRRGRRGDPHRRERPRCGCRSRISSRATGSRRAAAASSSSRPRATRARTSPSTCTRARFGLTNLYAALPAVGARRRAGRARGDPARSGKRDEMRGHRSILSAGNDWSRVVLLDNEIWPEHSRRDLASIAADRNQEPLDAVYDLLLGGIDELHKLMVIIHAYSEDQQREAFAHELCVPGLRRDDAGAERRARRVVLPRRVHVGVVVLALHGPRRAAAHARGRRPPADGPARRADRPLRPRRPPRGRARRRRRLRSAAFAERGTVFEPNLLADGHAARARERRADAAGTES